MAWRGARVKGPEEEKLLLSSPLQLQNSLRPGRWPTSAGEGTNSLKVNFFFFFRFVFVTFPLQVVSALESNPTARRTQLHHKLEQVIALVEDNIYECCSEA